MLFDNDELCYTNTSELIHIFRVVGCEFCCNSYHNIIMFVSQ